MSNILFLEENQNIKENIPINFSELKTDGLPYNILDGKAFERLCYRMVV